MCGKRIGHQDCEPWQAIEIGPESYVSSPKKGERSALKFNRRGRSGSMLKRVEERLARRHSPFSGVQANAGPKAAPTARKTALRLQRGSF